MKKLKLSESEHDVLKKLCQEITELRLKRLAMFGNDWQNKLIKHGANEHTRERSDQQTIDKYLRKIDETRALKNYTHGYITGKIGISRNTYYDMKNGHLSKRVKIIFDELDWEKL